MILMKIFICQNDFQPFRCPQKGKFQILYNFFRNLIIFIFLKRRPFVWLISGIATHWNRMGNDLLKVPVFKETLERCHSVLATKGLNLFEIITSHNETIFDNVLHCMVGIGAVQIGMINVLREIGLEPDYLVGISFGEIAAGYADRCLTEKQAMLITYHRGYTISKELKILGDNAIIGMSYDKLKSKLPEDCDCAAHVDGETCCVAGPKRSIAALIEKMEKENCFTTLINTSNVPLHSRYLAPLEPQLSICLNEVIPEARLRSNKWYSTSIHPEKWSDPKASECSGDYFVNNLLGCVYLDETSRLLPKESVILGIAPTCVLRTSMTQCFPNSVYVSLADKDKPNNIEVFLDSLKTLSDNGVNIDWMKVERVFDNNDNLIYK